MKTLNSSTQPSCAPVALTIAGSDSCGGAGIQADLATFHALGVHGASAITCLTSQNYREVNAIFPVAPDFVRAQIMTVAEDLPISALKTGMLYSCEIIQAVAGAIRDADLSNLVVDPVMCATSGAVLLRSDAIHAMEELILPKATLITPNGPEAEQILARSGIETRETMIAAAEELAARFQTAVLLKGGHLFERGSHTHVLDIWVGPSGRHEFERPSHAIMSHGSGCTLSAAIAAHLAQDDALLQAVEHGLAFIDHAFQNPVRVGPYTALNRFAPDR